LREWNLAQRGHLAATHFMEDLARLGVGEGVDRSCLIKRQPVQHAARDARIDPQHLECRDDSVATERRRIPWDARVGVSPLRRIRH
jgi:hypothetical protein